MDVYTDLFHDCLEIFLRVLMTLLIGCFCGWIMLDDVFGSEGLDGQLGFALFTVYFLFGTGFSVS